MVKQPQLRMELELRPEKSLLNNTFEGYKLNSKSLECLKQALVTKIHLGKKDPNKFTYNYTKQQLMQNHLFYNEWNDSIYFIDENCNITTVSTGEDVVAFLNVFQMRQDEELSYGFSPTISFPSKVLCIASTGTGNLMLLSIPEDPTKEWSMIRLLHKFDTAITILHSFLDKETSILHCIALSLKDFNDKEEKTSTTYALLHWLQISISNNDQIECAVRELKTFKGQSIPKNCWLKNDYKQFFVASDNEFELVNTTNYEKIQVKDCMDVSDNVKYYHWHQCKEMVTIVFDTAINEEDVDCKISHNLISIKLKSGQILLEGSLEKHVLKDASKWYIQDGKLEVVLVKKVPGVFWLSIIPNENHGIHDIEGEELDRLNQIHEQMEHLTSDGMNHESGEQKHFNMQQLEECDENVEEDIKVFSIDVISGKVTVEKSLGGLQWLFSAHVRTNGVPYICLRHDVDGVLWQPCPNGGNEWKHCATFDAFGYVLASKQEHKFVCCGPNMEYAVITDCNSNLYVYECLKEKTKTRAQFVASFPESKTILGCIVTKRSICLLTDSHLHVINLPKQ